MANYAKYTRGAVGHMCKHYERARDESGEYVKFGNRDIDPSRTHLNYNLAPERENQYLFVKNRCEDLHCLNRKDVNVLSSWIVTAPKSLASEEHDIFFKESYNFLTKKYGEENCISAYVHKDESGEDHLHYAFVPVVFDKSKERYKVSAKECVNRSALQRFHGELQKHLENALGHSVEILNEATKDGNKTVTELKRERELEKQQQAERETQTARQEAVEARIFVENVRAEVKPLEEQKEALKGEIEALQTEKDVLTSAEVEALKGEKNLFGGLKGVSHKEYEALKRTAAHVDESDRARDLAEQKAARAEAAAKAAYDDANRQLRERVREVENDRPSIQMYQENAQLRRENDELKREIGRFQRGINRLLQMVKEKAPGVYHAIVKESQEQNNKSHSRHDDRGGDRDDR